MADWHTPGRGAVGGGAVRLQNADEADSREAVPARRARQDDVSAGADGDVARALRAGLESAAQWRRERVCRRRPGRTGPLPADERRRVTDVHFDTDAAIQVDDNRTTTDRNRHLPTLGLYTLAREKKRNRNLFETTFANPGRIR